jgi:ADP-ribosylglycohydrolase/catechol 2,3-dioxygenase-like lactoylglutathione lyase family enzyme
MGLVTIYWRRRHYVSEDIALPSGMRDRVRGMFVSAAVGDALGWPQEQRSSIVGGQKARRVPPRAEFRRWERNSGTRFSRYRETVGSGEYSDDTQMLLAVARACLRGDWRSWLAKVELPALLLYERGAGRALLTAAQAWADGTPPWAEVSSRRNAHDVVSYYNAGANGVAMRIAPHVVLTAAAAPPEPLIERVIQDGICTHGHPRALVGGVLHAFALRHALLRRGTLAYGEPVAALLAEPSWQNPDAIEQAAPKEWIRRYQQVHDQSPAMGWKRAVDETRSLLEIAGRALERAALANDEDTLAELGCFDPSRNGAGHITAVAAAYSAARAAARPMSGLLLTAFLNKADTDTLASMTASLLGTVHGTDWIEPLADAVQDSHYIETLADQLAVLASDPEGGVAKAPQSSDAEGVTWRQVRRRDIDRFRATLENLPERGTGRFVDGRHFAVAGQEELPSSGKNATVRWRLQLDDRQTLIIDRTRRVSRAAEPSSKPRGLGDETPTLMDATGSKQESSENQAAEFVQMTLVVRDLDRSLRFYRDVLGLSVEREDETSVTVGEWLLLITIPDQDSFGLSNGPSKRILFTIQAADLLAVWKAARRFEVEVLDGRPDDEDTHIRLRDPDGNPLWVRRR